MALVPSILASIPANLRDELIRTFIEIQCNFRDARWEPSELNGGKFCETVYTILRGQIDGAFPSNIQKPANFLDACRALESAPASFSRSLRIQIPRMLIALYEVRNNRGVGHVGGDVNPNHMDATAVLHISKWILAEFVRVFHNVDVATAASIVDSIVERELAVVWAINGKRRVLDTSLSYKEKALLLLYHENGSLREKDLFDWIEHSNASVFRRDILRPAHKDKLIEYDEGTSTVQISPKGVRFVEDSTVLNRHLRGA